ncbi:hypothetical protein DLJ49_20975 [Rhodovulum sp. 12E13]|nr:hypothetical protein DLJ49_20975 [Rhodovulum sp. 12E13]
MGNGHGSAPTHRRERRERKGRRQDGSSRNSYDLLLVLSHLAAASHMTVIMSDLLEPLFSDAVSRDFAAGEVLFRAGDPVVSMILLQDGRADLVRHTGHGLRMILHRAGPGQILAEASAWSDVYHCDAVASEPCVAALLPREAVSAKRVGSLFVLWRQ